MAAGGATAAGLRVFSIVSFLPTREEPSSSRAAGRAATASIRPAPRVPLRRAAASTARHGSTAAINRDTSLPSVSPKPPAGLQEIALHVEDDERRFFELDRNRRRFGFDRHGRHASLPP